MKGGNNEPNAEQGRPESDKLSNPAFLRRVPDSEVRGYEKRGRGYEAKANDVEQPGVQKPA